MERDFKGVWIPKEIWLNNELTLLEKIIFIEIDSLDNEDHCIAGNEYFAEFCNCSESKVSKAISKLQELKMIEVMNFDGRHRKIRVVKSTGQSSKKYWADHQKVPPINIDNNINKKLSISKDIDNTKNFEFGKKKEPKQSLYSKCISLIDAYTSNSLIRELLTLFLDRCLENAKESGKPFYTNTFKGKLNTLDKLSDDDNIKRKIIVQTLDNGWSGFYELKTNRRDKNTAIEIEHINPEKITRANSDQKKKFREDIASGRSEKF